MAALNITLPNEIRMCCYPPDKMNRQLLTALDSLLDNIQVPVTTGNQCQWNNKIDCNINDLSYTYTAQWRSLIISWNVEAKPRNFSRKVQKLTFSLLSTSQWYFFNTFQFYALHASSFCDSACSSAVLANVWTSDFQNRMTTRSVTTFSTSAIRKKYLHSSRVCCKGKQILLSEALGFLWHLLLNWIHMATCICWSCKS